MVELYDLQTETGYESALVVQRWYRRRGKRSVIRVCFDGLPKIRLLQKRKMTEEQKLKRWMTRVWVKKLRRK